jgi:SAM-dependent methyltransferase
VIGTKSFWLALASVPLMVVGALSPWAGGVGTRVDGSQDEFVLVLAIAAALLLVMLAASDRRWLAALPLVVGCLAAALTGNDIRDVADIAPHLRGGLAHVEWGLYVALLGSIGLVLATALLLVEAAAARRRGGGAALAVRGMSAVRGGRRAAQANRRDGETLVFREHPVAVETLTKRWDEVRRVADLRPTDRVLDVGCAEGWYTLEFAKLVRYAHGIDIVERRIEDARRHAGERGVTNATFETADLIGLPLEPLSYDVTLFSSVWGAKGVGVTELANLLRATRRELVARVNVRDYPARLEEILDTCDENGFDALCFFPKLIVAVRRGADAEIPELPPQTLLPTSRLRDHPVVRAAHAGVGREGRMSAGEATPFTRLAFEHKRTSFVFYGFRHADTGEKGGDYFKMANSLSEALADLNSNVGISGSTYVIRDLFLEEKDVEGEPTLHVEVVSLLELLDDMDEDEAD